LTDRPPEGLERSMHLETLLNHASAALERQAARLVDFTDTEATVEAGAGLRKRRLDVPLAELRAWIEGHPERAREATASFFRGVGAVVLEPRPNAREAAFSFVEAAGRIVPSLEGPLFPMGAELALGEPIFGERLLGDRFLASFVELDLGRQLLTRARVATWGVSDDRAAKAGLSLLFHRTWDVSPRAESPEALPGLEVLRVGDGCEATRALLIESLLFERCRRGLWVAFPANDQLLLMDPPHTPERLTAFRERVRRLHADSAWPLSPAVWAIEDGMPVECAE
jgi:hypothetical protein